MKEPYIKKFSEVSSFKVWTVNGNYIRKNLNPEFTNFGHHYIFNFIPKNEFWIDEAGVPGDEKYFIEHLLVEYRLMEKGMDYYSASEKASLVEKRERAKSKLIRNLKNAKKHKEEVINEIHTNLLKSYSKSINVWIVKGEIVRGLFFNDFTEGGHDKVYPFIPAGEVWIDDDVKKNERRFIILHEIYERNLMSRGYDYEKAHKRASEVELKCRINPEILDSKIKEEMRKIKILEKIQNTSKNKK